MRELGIMFFQKDNIVGMIHELQEPLYDLIDQRLAIYTFDSEDPTYQEILRNSLSAYTSHLYNLSEPIKSDSHPEQVLKYQDIMFPKMKEAEEILQQLYKSIQ